MTETEKIQARLERGYTMAIYGTRENIHEQMLEDISSLLILNKALIIADVSQQSELFCKCTTDTDIYQSDGFIKCQTCYKPIKMQNCG